MGESITIIHTADLHLGMQPEKDLPVGKERAREVAESLPRLVAACNEQEADLLLIAGDLFHKAPLVRELKDVAYQFGKLAKTRVVMIAGNHDYISARSNYPAWIAANGYAPEDAAEGAQVTMFAGAETEKVYLPSLGTVVYGRSYHSQNVTEGIYDDIVPTEPGIRILLAHGGDPTDAPLDVKKIAGNGWDYVALGHIHKPGELAPGIVYPGSPEPLDRNETGPHGYELVRITVDDAGRRKTEATFVPFAKREYRDLEIALTAETTAGSLADAAAEAIAADGGENLYRLILTGRRDADFVPDKAALAASGNVTEVVDRTLPEYDLEALRAANADNLIGMFIDALAERAETDEVARKALYEGLTALLRQNTRGL
jgi:DNA repair exonuclease SbcCD nuclease subunit